MLPLCPHARAPGNHFNERVNLMPVARDIQVGEIIEDDGERFFVEEVRTIKNEEGDTLIQVDLERESDGAAMVGTLKPDAEVNRVDIE